MLQFEVYTSPVGRLLLLSDGIHLTGIVPGGQAPENAHLGSCPVLRQTEDWLDAYFRAEAAEMDIPLAPAGTAFQKRVWECLLAIPYGQSRSYGSIAREIARDMGRETMSPQAVGQAVGRNPIAVVIPCHRCVGADGRLTGYAWGTDMKNWLLNHEGWKQGKKEC